MLSEYAVILKTLIVPSQIEENLEDIALEKLRDRQFTTVFLDLDNTILTYRHRKIQLKQAQWVEKLKSYRFKVVLVTNNRNYKRVSAAADQLELECLYFAMKPLPFVIKHYAKVNKINLRKSVVIGDQLLTDVVMGNWLKCHTILVDSLDKKLSFIKTTQREIEKFLVAKFSR